MTKIQLPKWPKAYPEAGATGLLKANNADFTVTETPLALPTGEGEHIWLYVKKDGANTGFVANCIAAFANVKEMDVGYAGLKDRHAITEQWFSVYFPKGETPDFLSLQHDEFTVLKQTRHIKKLRRGDLRGNAFEIVLRDIKVDKSLIEANLAHISQQGVPNYFGAQRFGHNGDNVEQGRMMLAREIHVRSAKKKGIYLSAVRSFLFNEVLAERIKQNLWAKTIDGDVLNDGLPTGAMWGRGRVTSTLAAAELENTISTRYPDLCEGLEHAGLTQERRALVAMPENFAWSWQGKDILQLSFSLHAGQYATSVLAELLDVHEPNRMKAQTD